MADSYELVKNEIKKKSISEGKLENLKDAFSDEISSVRLKSCIQSIDDLLETLEHRDVINENQSDALNSIMQAIDENVNDINITNKLKQDRSDDNFVNQYALERLREEFEEETRINELQSQKLNNIGFVESPTTARMPIQNNNPVNSGLYSGTNKSAIYNLISTEIGRKWRDFGRGLGMREGEMDELDISYPRDFKTKIRKMLELFEEPGREDVREHVFKICDSLEQCRRKDLSKKIQKILTR